MNHFHRLSVIFAATVGAAGFPAESSPDRPAATSWLEGVGVSASTTVTSVDNLSRTSYAPTRQNGTTCELDLDASRHEQLAASWLLDAGVEAAWLEVPEYNLTDNLRAGPRLGLQRKFGLGPLAPVLQFSTSLTYKEARLPADRGWTTEAGVRLAKRLDPSLKVALSGRWLQHDASRATFDLQQRTLSFDAIWDITESWQLTGSASRLSGRVVANAAWSVWAQAIGGGLGPAVYNYYNSIPWEVTSLYGPGWVSYNVEATADLWSLSLNHAVSRHSSVELRTGGAYVINHIGIRYPTKSFGLAYLHRF